MRLPKCGVGLGWLSPGCCANLHKLHGQHLHKFQPCPLSPNDAVHSLNPLLIFRTITMPTIQGPTETDFSAISLNDDSVPSTRSSSPQAQYSISETEATFYYSGLPSSPRLVYRTGTTPWTKPTGPQAQRELKELRPVFGHRLNTVWKDLGPNICDFLDSIEVSWTTIDVVRFIKVAEGEVVGPVVLWIGVIPKTLFGEDAHNAADGCLNLLKESGITDVEVEFRESIYTRSVATNLLKPVSDLDPTVDVRGPLTPALGLFIAAEATPYAEGTGGFYLAEGGDSQKVLLVTAGHVLFPPNGSNLGYTRTDTSAPRDNVILLGTKAFDKLVKSIDKSIDKHEKRANYYKQMIEKFWARMRRDGKGDSKDDISEEDAGVLKKNETPLDEENKAIAALQKFRKEDVMDKWSKPDQRILGYIVRSPPITAVGAGTDSIGFTEDYAVVELGRAKIREAFMGNVIDLGTTISVKDFTSMSHRIDSDAPGTTTFEYPDDRLLKLQDIIQEKHMYEPDMIDHDGNQCLYVIKNGNTTGVTIGRANGIFSFVRQHLTDGPRQTSMEWSILSYGNKAFSDAGDSGSIIADGRGRMGGLLIAGASAQKDTLDVTYATPLFWLLPRIKDNGFPNAHLQPVMA